MKKLIALAVLVFLIFVVVKRDQIYLRDPMAKVLRNGERQTYAQVFINFQNDVLVENDEPLTIELVQHGQPVGLPKDIKCVHYVVCIMDAYPARLSAPFVGAQVESMSGTTVVFRDKDGKQAEVTLH